MKAPAPKHNSGSNTHDSKPFFKKAGEGDFFSKDQEIEKPFFPPSPIQPKLTIGAPDDEYEKEADRTADQVVQRLAFTPNQDTEAPQISRKPLPITAFQRKPEETLPEEQIQEKEETEVEETVMRKPMFGSGELPTDEDETIQQKSNASESHASTGLETRLNSSKGSGSPLSEIPEAKWKAALGPIFRRSVYTPINQPFR